MKKQEQIKLMNEIKLFPILNFPLIQPGDDVAALIIEHLAAMDERLVTGDVFVIAQKVVSKAEGRMVRLADVVPSAEALRIAKEADKDPRMVQVVLDDSNEVLRVRRGLLVVEQRSGWVCANAGVDRSNVRPDGSDDILTLLPADSDSSAEQIRQRLSELSGVTPAVIISDPRTGLAYRHHWRDHRLCRFAASLESTRVARPLWLRVATQRRVYRR